jgi:hypothetical protein
MTDDEMIAVLEEIARDEAAHPSARVTAVRTLWQWKRSAFDELYPDELRARRRAVARERKKRY